MQHTTPPQQPVLPAIFHRVCLFTLLSILASCNGQPQKTPEQQLELIGKPASGLDKNTDDIFQDRHGNYWFADNGAGVYWYNGKKLLHITDKEGLCSNFVWSVQEDVNGRIWFTTRDGVCRFDGAVITNYTDTIKNAPAGALHYTHRGGLFFGHLNGICFYNGDTFTKMVF